MSTIDSDKLIAARKAKGKTQADIAKHLKMDQSAYSRKERTGELSLSEIDKISSYLKVDKEALASEGVTISDLYKLLAEEAIKQDSMLRVILMAVGELLAEKKGVPVGTLLNNLTEAVNSQSLNRLEKLKL